MAYDLTSLSSPVRLGHREFNYDYSSRLDGRSIVTAFTVALAIAVCAPTGAAATAVARDFEVVAIEVTVDKIQFPSTLAAIITQSAFEEATWYQPGARRVGMRVSLDKLKLKSSGGAVAAMLVPFATNDNEVSAHVTLVDCATGGEAGAVKSKASDVSGQGLTGGDVAREFADTALGFIPIPFVGDVIGVALEAGTNGGGERDIVVEAMGRNLMTVAFADLYGSSAAKAVVKQRKAAGKLAKAAGTPFPRTGPGLVPAAAPAAPMPASSLPTAIPSAMPLLLVSAVAALNAANETAVPDATITPPPADLAATIVVPTTITPASAFCATEHLSSVAVAKAGSPPLTVAAKP